MEWGSDMLLLVNEWRGWRPLSRRRTSSFPPKSSVHFLNPQVCCRTHQQLSFDAQHSDRRVRQVYCPTGLWSRRERDFWS
jgi:hypothetical protein